MEKDYTEITDKLANILMKFDGQPDGSEPDKDSMIMKVTELKPPTYVEPLVKERDMEEPEPEIGHGFHGWKEGEYIRILRKPDKS